MSGAGRPSTASFAALAAAAMLATTIWPALAQEETKEFSIELVDPKVLRVCATRVECSAQAMINDLSEGTIDVGVLWGPMAGYYAKQASPPLTVVPLTHEGGVPPLVYRITMGVRFSDQEWKRLLNRMIEENQPAINEILLAFGVPLLDENNQPIREGSLANRP